MKKTFSLFITISLAVLFASSCEELLDEETCKEGETRIYVVTETNEICCPEGCICIAENEEETRNTTDGIFLPPNDTISIQEPPPSGDPIDMVECAELSGNNSYTLEPGTDSEIIMSLHEGSFDDLSRAGQNIVNTTLFFTRQYELLNGEKYYISIVNSKIQGKVIRFGYSNPTVFADRIALN